MSITLEEARKRKGDQVVAKGNRWRGPATVVSVGQVTVFVRYDGDERDCNFLPHLLSWVDKA